MNSWKVLLVDDEEEFASTLAERLQLRGISTRAVNSGEEALYVMGIDPPHVVVLDVLMPGMNGLEVLQQIRAKHANLPVILLTGQGSTKNGIEGMRLGAFDYLMKPLNIEELIAKMKEAVHSVQGTKEPEEKS
jgi:DNA-binding response OmpR family regulator